MPKKSKPTFTEREVLVTTESAADYYIVNAAALLPLYELLSPEQNARSLLTAVLKLRCKKLDDINDFDIDPLVEIGNKLHEEIKTAGKKDLLTNIIGHVIMDACRMFCSIKYDLFCGKTIEQCEEALYKNLRWVARLEITGVGEDGKDTTLHTWATYQAANPALKKFFERCVSVVTEDLNKGKPPVFVDKAEGRCKTDINLN